MFKSIRSHLLFIVLIILGCQQNSVNNHTPELHTITISPSIHDGKVEGYAHYVSVSVNDKIGKDSTCTMAAILKYSDTVSVGRPVIAVRLYHSYDNIPYHENAEEFPNMDENFLVGVIIDQTKERHKMFLIPFEGVVHLQNTWHHRTQNDSIGN